MCDAQRPAGSRPVFGGARGRSLRFGVVTVVALVGGVVQAGDDDIPPASVVEISPETAGEPAAEASDVQAEVLDEEPPLDAENVDGGTPVALDLAGDGETDGGTPGPESDPPSVAEEDPAVVVDIEARVRSVPSARVLDIESRVIDASPPGPVKLPPLPPLREPEPTNEFAVRGAAGLYFEPALGLGALALGEVTASRTRLGALTLDARLLGTRTLHQDHRLRATLDKPFDLPLFVRATGTFFATNALPYCGTRAGYACSNADAADAISTTGLEGNARLLAMSRYHRERVFSSGAAVDVGAHLFTGRVDADVSVGWFGEAIVDGELGDLDGDRAPDLAPFPHSLRDSEVTEGEQVISHGPRATFVVRSIDDENYPTRGFDLALAPRATTRALGATYDLIALAGSLEAFVPLAGKSGVVLASRTLFDVGLGDAHSLDRARFHVGDVPLGFGGIDVGRGMRLARHRGLVKAAEQMELRFERVIDSLFDLPLRVGAVAFTDLGYVAADVNAARLDPALVHFGFGAGARVGLGPLVMRGDLAVSPDEGFLPFPYLSVAHTF